MRAELFGVNPRGQKQEIEARSISAGKIGAQRVADGENALT